MLGERRLVEGLERAQSASGKTSPSGFDFLAGLAGSTSENFTKDLEQIYGRDMWNPIASVADTTLKLGKLGADTQADLEEQYPTLAKFTDYIIPQDAGGVLSAPFLLGGSLLRGGTKLLSRNLAKKAPSKLNTAARGYIQGTLNEQGSPSSLPEETSESLPRPTDDVAEQIAREGRVAPQDVQPASSYDTPNAMMSDNNISAQDILALLSDESEPVQKKNPLTRFFNDLNTSYNGRNYLAEEAMRRELERSPQETFASDVLPQLLEYQMQQDAKLQRAKELERYKVELLPETIRQLQGFAPNM